MNLHEKIVTIENISELFEISPKITEFILDIANAKTGALNFITNEYGFISSFKKEDLTSIKNKYIERYCIVSKNHTTHYDTKAKNMGYRLETIINRFNKGSSFKFIFEGKSYFLYNNINYINDLINKKYLNQNYLNNLEKRYKINEKDINFKTRYPSFSDFIEKITIPLKSKDNIFGFITLDQISRKNKKKQFSKKYISRIETIVNKISKTLFKKINEINKKTKETIETLERLKTIINNIENPPYTYNHSTNVTNLYYDFIRYLAKNEQIQLKSSDSLSLKIGAKFHDIGKIHIAPSILNKPGKLTKQEFEKIKEHPRIGYELVRLLYLPRNTYELILHHHEKLDGSGYPDHLKDEISDIVRVFTIIDIFEALIGKRPYKPEYSINKALTIIEKMPKQIDEKYVFHFKKYLNLRISELNENIYNKDTNNKKIVDYYKHNTLIYLNSKINDKNKK